MPQIEYWIGDRKIALQVTGATKIGKDHVLLDEDDNLIEQLEWDNVGYTVTNFLCEEDFRRLCERVCQIVRQECEAVGVSTDDSFTLENYHSYVDTDDFHSRVIGRTRLGYSLDRLPFSSSQIVDRISQISGVEVSARHPDDYDVPFHFRIARPGKPLDGNPPHRDAWLDRLRNGLNIYVPIAGSDDLSSLPLLPGSHRWPENEVERTEIGALIGGLSYSVPAVTRTKMPYRMVRPNPGMNQVLLFSPYLIHGGARNFNEDRTRVSLEMRFWRQG